MKVRIFTDGACEPKNPGGFAVAAFVAIDSETKITIAKHAEIVASGQNATNNLAEVAAIAKALSWVESRPEISDAEICSDSQLAVNLVNRFWRPDPSKRYYPPLVEALSLFDRLRSKGVKVEVRWVSRDFNIEADSLAVHLALCAAKEIAARERG